MAINHSEVHLNKSALSDDDKNFIWEHYKTTQVSKMANHLGKWDKAVYTFMYENGLETVGDLRVKPKRKVAEGMFDEKQFDNWLI
jgi:hypothetical protein